MTNMKKPIDRCYWVVPGKLLAGYYPGDADAAKARSKLDALLDAGVRTFINLMEADETNWQGKPFAPYDGLVRELTSKRKMKARCLRFPIPDQSIPSEATMDAIQAMIAEATADGAAAYVHCWGGKGRTGTVIGCYLIRHGLATPKDFVQVIEGLRGPDRNTGPSPENETQIGFVRIYSGRNRTAKPE